MADAFVQNFIALPNVEERTEALMKLAAVLSVAERKVLVDAISGRSDLVPALPFELLVQVFKHLHIHDAWSLQLVNRRWRTELSSGQFLRTALRRWDTDDPSDSGRSVEDIAHDSIADRIRHMQSLRLGKPFSQAEYDDTGTGLQGPQPRLSQRKLDLNGKNVAYISSKPGEGDAVVLRNLVTGSVSLFHGDARERIVSLALSTELIAFVTFDGYLHVARFAEPVCSTRRRLPSAHIRALGADGSKVAVALGENHCNVFEIAEVLLFDAKSQRLRTIDIAPDKTFFEGQKKSLSSCSILVDGAKEVIDLFSLGFCNAQDAPGAYLIASRCLEILHLRVTFAGECVAMGTVRYAIGGGHNVRSSHFTMAAPTPTGYLGQYRIQVGSLPFLGGLPMRLTFGALFDAGNSEANPSICGLFLDDNAAEYYGVAESAYRRNQSKSVQGTLHTRWKSLAIQATKQPDNNWLEYCSLMNNSFLVSLEVSAARMQHSRIRAFCFDQKIDLHTGRSTGFWRDGELQPV